MKISENAQELLELLWITSEEVDTQPTSAPQTSGDYQELVQLGLVVYDAGLASLTETGKKEAAMAIRRHRLARARRLESGTAAARHPTREEPRTA